MKFLTTTLLVATLTITTFANTEMSANFNVKKEKILTKITTRIAKVENRKSCMEKATSLKEMQLCRIEKNRNKPFKMKKGITFEVKQSKIVNRISKRLTKMNQRKSCVENSLTNKALKACRTERKNKKH